MPFQPGQSGNPGGRPKAVRELQAMAAKHIPKAIRKAKELVGSEDGRVAIAAATFLRDTGIGRPAQVPDMSPEAWAKRLADTPGLKAAVVRCFTDAELMGELVRREEASQPSEVTP